MTRETRVLTAMLVLGWTTSCLAQTGEEIFSGPQGGEKIEPFVMSTGFGDQTGQEINLLERADGGPLVVIFVHKRSRPAFGLANAIMRYCVKQDEDRLASAICFLTDDLSDTETWLANIRRYFPEGATVGISADGAEGPGSWGLNRNVELTIVVANHNTVVDNFALIQPGFHADGPQILTSIATAIGDESVPDINDYLPTNQANQDAQLPVDPKITEQMKILTNANSSIEEIDQAIRTLTEFVADRESLQKQLGRLAFGLVRSERVKSIGEARHQEIIAGWARRFGPRMRDAAPRGDKK